MGKWHEMHGRMPLSHGLTTSLCIHYIFVMHTDCLSSCLAALQVALVVAQRRESGGRLSGIKLSALSIGLQRVAKMARKKKGKKNSSLNLLSTRKPLLWC